MQRFSVVVASYRSKAVILCGCGFLPFSGSDSLWLWLLTVLRQRFSVVVASGRSKAAILCGCDFLPF